MVVDTAYLVAFLPEFCCLFGFQMSVIVEEFSNDTYGSEAGKARDRLFDFFSSISPKDASTLC